MTVALRFRRKAMACFGLMTLLTAGMPAFAATSENIWQSTFGQRWFYESRSGTGEMLAGTWWEGSLEPGNTYRISFTVNRLNGSIGLLVGDNPLTTIDRPGDYAYEFSIRQDGRRRIVFTTRSRNVTAGVNRIEVARRWTEAAVGGDWSGGDWGGDADGDAPRGHYLSFARERDLRAEVVSVLDNRSHWSHFAIDRAERIDGAFRTPGVRGFWMAFDWGNVEIGDGTYDWRLMDANMDVARRYGLKMLVKIGDRSFNGSNILPRYFPSRYVLWTEGGGNTGVIAKRWDPYVYERLIRIYRRIADRYASHAGFGGIASTETAVGSFTGGDYSVNAYREALIQIATQTQSALTRGKFFMYMNFIRSGQSADMNRDVRIDILKRIPHHSVVLGGPDVLPDNVGMPGSVNSYRVHARKNFGAVRQFCHLQHADQGQGGYNVKSNRHRDAFREQVQTIRERESQSWFQGAPAVIEFDDIRDPQGRQVDRHPSWVVGRPWQLQELLDFGTRNFDCQYFIWHFREHPQWNEYGWEDVRPVILNNQYFW